MTAHTVIGALCLFGIAGFVAFAFRKGMGVRRSGRRDDGAAFPVASDGGSHHGADSGGGFGHG